jgi:hypothetical protein
MFLNLIEQTLVFLLRLVYQIWATVEVEFEYVCGH